MEDFESDVPPPGYVERKPAAEPATYASQFREDAKALADVLRAGNQLTAEQVTRFQMLGLLDMCSSTRPTVRAKGLAEFNKLVERMGLKGVSAPGEPGKDDAAARRALGIP